MLFLLALALQVVNPYPPCDPAKEKCITVQAPDPDCKKAPCKTVLIVTQDYPVPQRNAK